MSLLRVRVSSEARRQIREIAAWWYVNRSAAPGLFREELADALALLAQAAELGALYPDAPLPNVRRLLLLRTRYHLYYTIREGEGEVFVRAIWHAVRGEGPDLG